MEPLSSIYSFVFSEQFALGMWMTLKVSVLSVCAGLLLGLMLAVASESRFWFFRSFSLFYLWLFRGTPVLFQLIFIFNVLPQIGIVLPGFVCAVVALSLNEAANMSEIMRGGLQAIGRNQRVAGRALSLTESQILRFVVIPQALRVVIPPIGNQFVNMLKLSALVSVIAVQDLMLVANQAASASFKYLEALGAAGIYYLTITSIFMVLQGRIEWWANPKNRRALIRLNQPA